MEHKNFVTAEEISAEQNNIKTLVRFASSLTLLKKLLAPTMLMIFCAAAVMMQNAPVFLCCSVPPRFPRR